MYQFDALLDALEPAKQLGEEITPNGARLLGWVKDEFLGINRWWHYIFPKLSDVQIVDLEESAGIPFPSVFKDFLKNTNGLIIFSGALSLYGARLSNDRRSKDAYPYPLDTPNLLERPKDATANFLFIGGYSWDGSKLYIDTHSEKVYRCAKNSAAPINEWPDFWSMIISEASRISNLYESDGKKIDLDFPTSPGP
ncbi:SMI1/KNR4 family protein [Andreprevotia chitinilytica]|uniref:SMI1/KNR4 family protein n=1 Tax=Andreprevotia chitinilytica TaxID=396808 RepID=UPI0012EC3583